MHNLLIETIVRQANAGAFGDLGSVESVEVESSSGFGSSFGIKNGDGGIRYGPIIGGVVAALLVAGSVYLFCFRGKRDGEANPKGQNDDTSDEEQYTSSEEEEDKRQKQITIPEAQVVAVEDPAGKSEDAKKEQQGWW
jgi:hypothetical protein